MIGDGEKSISSNNRGVSPVIGVILMVAITVILAAVIGGFVLGLGGDLQSAPQAQISIDSAGNNAIEISHDGGDAIAAADLLITDDGTYSSTLTDAGYGEDELAVGDSYTVTGVGADTDLTVKLIHQPSESVIAEATVDTS